MNEKIQAVMKDLTDIMEAVEYYLTENALSLAPRKKAELISVIYQMYSDDENKENNKK